MTRVIRKNLGPFSAIIVLIVIAVVVGVYILGQQRLRFPVFQEQPMRIKVELDNAQAVTPGQGQTAQVAGVEIGRLGKVQLKNGRAVVELEIERRYDDLIHRDARALLRPRTGLKDMYVQILPGHEGPPIREGFVIRASNTLTDVDVDEVLSALDRRTRDYITLLVDGAGRGLRNKGNQLARVFERFGPTVRDLARVNRAVAQERVALRRLVSSLSQINGTLAKRPRDLSELVDSGATTMRAFASEDANLRETVSELAPTLSAGTRALRAVQPFARELGPATRALVPAVRELDDANREVRPFAREAAPIVRTKIRPFARAARPLVSDLRPAARDLSETFPELDRSATVLNHFFNMLGHNPGGGEAPEKSDREEGYLFWLAWVTHQTANLQNVEDANGPMRPIFLTGTCATFTSLVNDFPPIEFAAGLSPLLATVCRNPDTTSLNLTKSLRVVGAKRAKKGGGK